MDSVSRRLSLSKDWPQNVKTAVLHVMRWRHHGLGSQSSAWTPYTSERISRELRGDSWRVSAEHRVRQRGGAPAILAAARIAALFSLVHGPGIAPAPLDLRFSERFDN
jgi:hypothetical protein